MEQIDGLESVIKIISSKAVLLPATIFLIVGIPFFFPTLISFLSIPKIIVDYGEWIKFITYFSFVVILIHLLVIGVKTIINFFSKRKKLKELDNNIKTLTDKEIYVVAQIYYNGDNFFAESDPIIIELQRKGMLYCASNLGNQSIKNHRVVVEFPYALYPVARKKLEKKLESHSNN
jgi:hypothetical protein